MKLALLGVLICASISPAFAASPFDGAWKLDLSKSHYEGETFSYTKKPNGLWTFTNGSTVTFDFGTDGKPWKTLDAEDTTTTKMDNDHSWTYTGEFKGKVTSRTHEEVSADGKTLTNHTENFRPDGSKSQSDTTFTRISGSRGFEGKWKSTKVTMNSPDGYTISSGSDGTMTWTIPSQQAYVVSKLDGKPEQIHGPTYAEGFTLALTKGAAHDVTYKVAMKGKVLSEGKMVVAADGKSLVDTSWSPGKESEKNLSYYVKQ